MKALLDTLVPGINRDLFVICVIDGMFAGSRGGGGGGGPYNPQYQNRRPDHYRQHERRDTYPPPMRRDR